MAGRPPRIAVVTVPGSGIAATVAHALAGGWVVVLAGRRREPLASVAE